MQKTIDSSQQLEMTNKAYLYRNMRMMVLFKIPVAYLAVISAVIVHEIIGHGLTAVLLGGKFSGFGILIDGMGWAMLDLSGMEVIHQVLVLFSGAFFTSLLSIAFFVIAHRFSKHYLTSMMFLLFAFAFLMDGVPYFFWDAIYRGGIGDVSKILLMVPSDLLRGVIIVLTGLLFLAGIFFFNLTAYTQTIARFAAKGTYRLTERVVIASGLIAIQILGWVSFDWKQLIPVREIGCLPMVVPILLTLVSILGIMLYENKRRMDVTETRQTLWKAPILISWCVCIACILTTILCFQNGVVF